MSGLTEQARNAVSFVEISAVDAGQRIDNFLLRYLKGVPRSRIYRILRRGEVRVNRQRAKPDYRTQVGDIIRIPPLRTAAVAVSVSPTTSDAARLNGRILYEDDALLILNKPSGMAVHGGSGVSYGVIEALRAIRPRAPYLELVHRLDRDTSGCLMVAKKRSELRRLHQLLREGRVTKRYLALAKGRWRGGQRCISTGLRKNTLRSGERMVRVEAEGKTAITEFAPVRRYQGATLLQATLLTGRTHQIRVHAAHSGHPLAGDPKYGDTEFNRRLRGVGLRRLFLHAHGLEFVVPQTHKHIQVTAPLDEELNAVLSRLADVQTDGERSPRERL